MQIEGTDRDKAVAHLMADRPEWARTIILAGLRGSDAHGTKLGDGHARSTDDVDTFGVSVHDRDWYLGLDGYTNNKRRLSWDTAGDRYDHLIHDVRKFFALLIKGNPNVHCWLWVDPEDRIALHEAGRMIVDERELFLSRHCFNALAGYAKSQLHKMDRKKYAGYQGAKRKKLVDEIGYDVKHAAHCIRLLYMGIELAETGIMSTRRPQDEASMLREIKAGAWPFRRTERLALDLFSRFSDAEERSDLREDVDREKANSLLVRVMECTWATQSHHRSNA